MKHTAPDIPALKSRVSGNSLLNAGPCVVESEDIVFSIAERLVKLSELYSIPFIFKSSYRKANRSKADSFTGIGDIRALEILAEVRKRFSVPVITDIHNPSEAGIAAGYVDVLQIPAFLCRQTDLLEAAALTEKWINIKKGQFLAPDDMRHAAEKVRETGNERILLTERGSTFGYHNLVVDMRSLPIMRETGYPVVLDATHSVQLPGGDRTGNRSGGQPEFIFPIARAGVAAGCDALFIEVHPDPPAALSDAASQLRLDLLDRLLGQVVPLHRLVQEWS